MNDVVLVSGGTGGIGEACVRLFASKGHPVLFLTSAQPEKAAALALEMRESGASVDWKQCDLRDPNQVRTAIRDLLSVWHRIDILINNAGVSFTGLLTDMSDEDWNRIFDVNVRGAFLLCRELLPGMISRRKGNIVNIASMWGETGASCEVAYSASKAALIGLTKALAKEAGPSGIRVNCITPGVIDTRMNAHLSEGDLADLADSTPLGRIGTPGEVAEAALFLSENSSSFITGQILGVNGGFVI